MSWDKVTKAAEIWSDCWKYRALINKFYSSMLARLSGLDKEPQDGVIHSYEASDFIESLLDDLDSARRETVSFANTQDRDE